MSWLHSKTNEEMQDWLAYFSSGDLCHIDTLVSYGLLSEQEADNILGYAKKKFEPLHPTARDARLMRIIFYIQAMRDAP